MVKVAGSMWVDGSTLHYIDPLGSEWYFTGTAGTTPGGAIVGSIWVDSGNGTIHYIDASGVDRAVAVESGSSRSGVGAVRGSLWVDTVDSANNAVHTIDNLQVERIAHTDITVSIPASHTDTHGDAAAVHSDVAASHSDGHSDTHDDSVGAGGHGDQAHHDYHVDGHYDDFHFFGPPFDWLHYDWNPYSDHEDWPHGDQTTTGHGDVAHTDHDDAVGGGYGRQPGHYDGGVFSGSLTPTTSGGYTDSHDDWTASSGSHGDSHGDGHGDSSTAHTDSTTPHSDTHGDVTIPHTDSHTDQPVSLGP